METIQHSYEQKERNMLIKGEKHIKKDIKKTEQIGALLDGMPINYYGKKLKL